jgi:hypothetical protein
VGIETIHNRVRITAPKQQALYAASDIVRRIEEAVVQEFRLEDAKKVLQSRLPKKNETLRRQLAEGFREHEIQAISKATGASISKKRVGMAPTMSAMTAASPSPEDPVNVSLYILKHDIIN